MEEIEVKFLKVKKEDIIKNLEGLGAEKIGDFLFKRKSYDFPDYRLAEKDAWVRIRDEGERTVMTYKQRLRGDELGYDKGMLEQEIVISDFVIGDNILKSIGMIEKFYEENERVLYVLDDVEVCIDTWPLLDTYVELEGSSWESLQKVADKLGFNWESHKKCSTMQVYKMEGIDENDFSVLTFETQIKK